MKLTAIDHITINVIDLEVSKAFYEKVLGLEPAGFVDMGDHTLTYYGLPGGVRLELIRYLFETPTKSCAATDKGVYRHFCLVTDSLDEVMENCARENVVVRQAPAYVEKLAFRNILIEDPNGVEIEIIEK